jgi:hypothetical protein
MGLGFGLGLSTLLVMTPLVVSDQDMAVTMGALTQIRVMGGTSGLAICATIFNNYIDSKLGSIVSAEDLQKISNSASNIISISPSHRTRFGSCLQMVIRCRCTSWLVLVGWCFWGRF